MWKFSELKEKRMTLISCIVMCDYAPFCAYPHTIQVWGIVSFVLVRVIPQPPL